LTLSSVSKRVREIGSLRAIGWSRGRVVRQIMAETLGIGVVGGVIGIAVGSVICLIIGAVGPGTQRDEHGSRRGRLEGEWSVGSDDVGHGRDGRFTSPHPFTPSPS
jgi:ABC-type antimicrobial peptide transport system permease subunit